MNKTPHQRGAVRKAQATLVAVWLPNDVLHALDRVVQDRDSDRSKTIRAALRRHLDAKPA